METPSPPSHCTIIVPQVCGVCRLGRSGEVKTPARSGWRGRRQAAEALQQLHLGIPDRLASGWLGQHIGAIGLLQPRGMVVGQVGVQFATDPLLQFLALDREAGFHATLEVSLHQVGAGEKKVWLAIVVEPVDPAVLEESAHDGGSLLRR
jgi:hypothetical protein